MLRSSSRGGGGCGGCIVLVLLIWLVQTIWQVPVQFFVHGLPLLTNLVLEIIIGVPTALLTAGLLSGIITALYNLPKTLIEAHRRER